MSTAPCFTCTGTCLGHASIKADAAFSGQTGVIWIVKLTYDTPSGQYVVVYPVGYSNGRLYWR